LYQASHFLHVCTFKKNVTYEAISYLEQKTARKNVNMKKLNIYDDILSCQVSAEILINILKKSCIHTAACYQYMLQNVTWNQKLGSLFYFA
jgi:hypothetical protein